MPTIIESEWADISERVNNRLPTPINIPILLDNSLHQNLIEWNEQHFMASDRNTAMERFMADPKKAKLTREARFFEILSNTLISALNSKTTFPIRFSFTANTLKGKVGTLLFIYPFKIKLTGEEKILVTSTPPTE